MPKVAFEGFTDWDFRPSEVVTGRMDHIHELFLDHEYELVDDLPRSGDLVVLIDKPDRKRKLERLASHGGRVVLVAAPTDGPFWRSHLPYLRMPPANLAAAFVANNDLPDPRVISLPVGVLKRKAERCRRAKLDRSGARDRLLLVNFNLHPEIYRTDASGNPHIRQRLADRFDDCPWATVDVSHGARPDEGALAAYYASLARHRFALSPEGLGADCYRHWECLYLGAVPIVRSSPEMTAFAELPILFTKDYSEIDEAYLEAQWQRFAARRFDLRKLTTSYYRELFRQAVSLLSKPSFLCWGFHGTSEEGFLEQVETIA